MSADMTPAEMADLLTRGRAIRAAREANYITVTLDGVTYRQGDASFTYWRGPNGQAPQAISDRPLEEGDAALGVVIPPLTASMGRDRGHPGQSGKDGFVEAVASFGTVRRLTPVECARLQGFPDNWNDHLSDSARYRQYGNAVAVPMAAWVMRRIVLEEEGLLEQEYA
jgi:site-specific DNA-cytosine methylase